MREDIKANFEHVKISRTLALMFVSSCLGVHPDCPPGVCLWGQMDAAVARAVPAHLGIRSLLATHFQDGCPRWVVQTRA